MQRGTWSVSLYGNDDYCNITFSRVHVFDKLFDDLPQLSEIKMEEMRLLPMDWPERFFPQTKKI